MKRLSHGRLERTSAIAWCSTTRLMILHLIHLHRNNFELTKVHGKSTAGVQGKAVA